MHAVLFAICVVVERSAHQRADVGYTGSSAFLSPRPFRPSPHQSLAAVGVFMSVQPSVTVTEPAPPQTLTRPVEPSSEERWAAWQARGDEHDRALRRNVRIAIPSMVVAAAVLYQFFAR